MLSIFLYIFIYLYIYLITMKYYLSAVNDYYKQFVIFQPPGQLEGSTVVLDLVQSGGKKKKTC